MDYSEFSLAKAKQEFSLITEYYLKDVNKILGILANGISQKI
ncbi:hypothetical protein [Nostoc sp.]